MIVKEIAHRLHNVAILPALRASLEELVAQDDITTPRNWGFVIPTIAQALGAPDTTRIQPFATAWGLLNAALRRLDHLQDGDVPASPLPMVVSSGAQYNLLLSYYLLAMALLDDLDPHIIPAPRLLRLRRLWADCLLCVASGQQADLELVQEEQSGLAALDHYQCVVQVKTGALFALAFGGTATLVTDDSTTITGVSFAGEVYGTLVQYSDDICDAANQVNPTLTLPRAYAASRARYAGHLPAHDVQAFWRHIYPVYVAHVERALATLPAQVQTGVRRLFATTFEDAQHREVT